MSKRNNEDSKGSRKRKRVSLSITEKVQILQRLEKGSSVKMLCEEFNVGLSTIYDLKKQKEKVSSFFAQSEDPKSMNCRKTVHQARNTDVDKVLLEWIRQRRSENFPLDRATIMAQARKFHLELGVTECEYSTGWFSKFKSRHGLRLIKACGEKASADVDSAEAFCDDLNELITKENLTLDQIFNADETSLFWRYLPRTTYATVDEKNPTGFKDRKERLTVLACANAAGNYKCKLMVIGKSRNPRPFKHIKVFPVTYKANKCSWVTTSLFKDWFDEHFVSEARSDCRSVGLPENCKILLLIDNCAAHPKGEVLRQENVIVCFLPPNCTSLIQPLDQGVLRSFKCLYKKKFLEKMLNSFNSDCGGIEAFQKKFNIKDAIWDAAKAWDEVTNETLKNAWHNLIPHTIFFGDENDQDSFDGFHISKEKLLVDELLEFAKTVTAEKNVLSKEDIEDCFNAENNVPAVSHLTDEEIINSVLKEKCDSDSEDNVESDTDASEPVSNERCITLIEELIKGMEQKSFVDQTHMSYMYKVQELFLKHRQNNLKQTKLTDLFKPK